MIKNDLTQERLKELLSYDPETGVFVWVKRTGNQYTIGMVAGCLHWKGYLRIQIDRKKYFAHRLAWLYITGVFPPNETDHINRNRADNRFVNLREVTGSQNQHNSNKSLSNTSGFKGVSYHTHSKKWHAYIKLNHARKHLGYFSTPEEASAAYLAAKPIYHPTAPILLAAQEQPE